MYVIIVNVHHPLYQYTAHWLLLYGIIMLLSYAIGDFYFFYDGAVDMQIWALIIWHEFSVKSLILRWMLRHVDLYLEHNFTNFRKSLFVFSYFNIKIDEFDKKLMTYKSLQIMLDITPLLNSSVCLNYSLLLPLMSSRSLWISGVVINFEVVINYKFYCSHLNILRSTEMRKLGFENYIWLCPWEKGPKYGNFLAFSFF